MKILTILLSVATIAVYSCRNANGHDVFADKFINGKNGFVKMTFDSIGNIKTKQYFTYDSVRDGAVITYYPNGMVKTWDLYLTYQRRPLCSVRYGKDGSFQALKGSGIIDTIYGEKYFDIGLIPAPHLKYRLEIKDVCYGRLINSFYTYPTAFSDTTNWVILDLKFKKSHKYTAYFCLDDSIGRHFDCIDSLELRNPLQ